ncbi:MAG: cell envelope integrity protein TolA [Endozoicomonas sp.]
MKKGSVFSQTINAGLFSSGSFLRRKIRSKFVSYGLSTVVSLFLHLLMLGFLTNSWSDDSKLKIVPPQNIRASLVELPKPEPVPEKQQPRPPQRPKADEARKAREQAERQRQKALRVKQQREREIALKQQQEAEEKARHEAEARRERERRERLEQERLRKQQEELRQRLQQEQLQREQTQAAAQAEQEATEVARYSGLFRQLVAQHWNRPPSARNNMVATLQVALSPYGDLLEVRLIESSGNDAYDRSVVQAVQRAAPFPEVRNLERRIFDKSFRRFNFRFRPEDLVR